MKSTSRKNSQPDENRISQVVFADSMKTVPSINLLDILRRQKWLIFFMMSLCLAAAALYWARASVWYESTARILVSQQDPRLTSTQSEATAAREEMVDKDVLANHMEVIRSRRIVEGALKRQKLEDLPSIREQLKDPEDDAADYVADHLKLSKGGEGSARDARSLKLSFEHTQPDETRLILEAIVLEYQSFLGEQLSKAMSQANSLVEDARVSLEKELNNVQQEYITLRQAAPVISQGDGTGNVYVEQYRRLHEELLTLDIKESSDQSRLEKAKAVLASKTEGQEVQIEDLGVIDTESLNRLGVFATLQTDSVRSAKFQADQPARLEEARTTYTHLLKLMSDQRRLEADFGPGHPDVRKLEEEITLVKTFVDERSKELNPGWEDNQLTPDGLLKAYIAFLQSDLAAVQERRTELNILLADAEKQARVLVEFELKEGILKSRVERTQSLFDGLVEKLRDLDLASGMHGLIHELLESPRKGEKIWPKLSICGGAGLMLGLIAGVFLAVVNDQRDHRFHSPSEIDDAIGLPILARIGRIKSTGKFPVVIDSSAEGESFRMLRTLLLNDSREGRLRILSGTSPLPGDGKTTVLCNIAAAFAKLNMQVVLVEADMRRPTFYKRFGVPEEGGLSDVLRGTVSIEKALIPSGVENLTLMTAGSETPNPSELLENESFDRLLKDLSARFQLVVIDVGPVLAVSDPVIISQKSDGTLLIVRSARDTRQQVVDSVETLRAAGAKLLGCVVNTYGSGNEFERQAYYGYGKYYADRNGK